MAKAAGGTRKKKRRSKRVAGKGKRRASSTVTRAAAAVSVDSWNPSKFALWSQRWGDPHDDGPTAVLLRHPTAPFVRIVDTIDDNTMQQLGFDYLSQASKNEDIDPPLGLPKRWLEALNPANGPDSTFWWLPIRWPAQDLSAPNAADPFVSFRVNRGSRSAPLDQTVVLLASEWFGNPGKYTGSGFGIRVVAHVRKTGKQSEVCITGMSASLPFGVYLSAGFSTMSRSIRDALLISFDTVFANASAIKTEMAATLRLENDSVKIRGLRLAQVAGTIQVEWRGTGKAKTTDAIPYSFVFVGTPGQAGALVSKVELVADATPPVPGHARVFPRDPASHGAARDIRTRRRTRSEQELDICRTDAEITARRKDPLQYPRRSGTDMSVVVCPRFVLEDRKPPIKPGDTKKVDLPGTGPAIRSNNFSAVMAYWNVEQFFQRFEAYGLDADEYFHIAKLPLKLYYRSGIRPGPGKDGQTVNARVLVEGWPVDFEGPTKRGERPGLEMHLALANLSHRARKPWNRKDRSPAESLGIAADARWIWHEIGHVLLMASVGELQFRFCHSAGDALAAIVADPQSELATDANWRGATFPWVFIPRRHDRCVSHGWSWGGSLHYAMSQVPSTQAPRRKGYWTEQILSSSLFRLYRCIGGNTTQVGSPNQPDIYVRESASHYSVYLIMRGIQILGPSDMVPAHKPDQLVSALIDADIGTEKWDVTFPPTSATLPEGETRFKFHRVGGCVHKVIRWAFEAQGLYRSSNNAPGYPPPVDVYIEDRRTIVSATSHEDIQYGPGSYAPVSLDWDPKQRGSHVPPAWQATEAAIKVQGNNICVTVGNRGSQPAQNVNVSVWWRRWPKGMKPEELEWHNEKGWTPCTASAGSGQTIAAGGSATFEFSHKPPGNRYLVLAIATCEDDRANTYDATKLPCSNLPTPLLDLVANDNNLGLRVIGDP